MESRYKDLQDALVEFDFKSKLVFFLRRDIMLLTVFTLEGGAEYQTCDLTREIRFLPTRLLPNSGKLAVVGERDVHVLAVQNPQCGVDLGHRQLVQCVRWHPLNDSYLGALTGDQVISFYDLEGNLSAPEVWKLGTLSLDEIPVSFCLFQEDSLSLLRFCCVVLMSNGVVYCLSPLVIRSFYLSESIFEFEKVLKVNGNSYLRREPNVGNWFQTLILYRKPRGTYSNETHFEVPKDFVDRYRPAKAYLVSQHEWGAFTDVLCLNSSNPTVLALIRDDGTCMFYVGVGDIVPAFQERTDEFLHLHEEIEFESTGSFCYENGTVYFLNKTALYKALVPWVDELRETVLKREKPRPLTRTRISKICDVANYNGMAIVQHQIFYNFIIIPQRENILFISLDTLKGEGELFELPEMLFEDTSVDQPTPSPISLLRPSEIKIDISKERITNENEEIAVYQRVMDKFVSNYIEPLYERIVFIEERVQEFNQSYDDIQREIKKIYPNGVEQIKQANEHLEQRIAICQENSKKIEDRIKSIIERQRMIKRPLSYAERECLTHLTRLEKATIALKCNAASVPFI